MQMKASINLEMKDTADLMKMLSKVVEEQGGKEAMKYFETANKNNPSLTSVYFGEESTGSMYMKPESVLPEGYDPRKRPWYEAAKGKEYYITEPYIDASTNKMIISICSEVKKDGKILGIVACDYMLDKMSENINKTKIGESGYIFVMSDTGVMVVNPNEKYVGKDMKKEFKFIKEIAEKKTERYTI